MKDQASVLGRIAHLQGRRDEVPNQQLAEELCVTKNRAGIKEIAENLSNEDPDVQADCLKVLYEVGHRDAKLVAQYDEVFLELLQSRNNRLVWGAMIALSTVVSLRVKSIGLHVDKIIEAMKKGSVITVDNGVSVLASLASSEGGPRKKITSFLFKHLKTCRPKDVPQHSERILAAINGEKKRSLGRS